MIKKQIKSFTKKFNVNQLWAAFLLLSSLFLLGCKSEPSSANLQRIIDRGYVTIGTLYGNTSYYLDAEGAAGFEYELAQKYANFLGVELSLIHI